MKSCSGGIEARYEHIWRQVCITYAQNMLKACKTMPARSLPRPSTPVANCERAAARSAHTKGEARSGQHNSAEEKRTCAAHMPRQVLAALRPDVGPQDAAVGVGGSNRRRRPACQSCAPRLYILVCLRNSQAVN